MNVIFFHTTFKLKLERKVRFAALETDMKGSSSHLWILMTLMS